MKNAIVLLIILMSMTAGVRHAVAANCSQAPFSNWTTSWTDAYGETRYAITAPCKVYIGVPFNVKAWVTDTPAHAGLKVAYPYAVQDTYSSATTHRVTTRIDPDGTGYDGSNTIYVDASSYWETVIPVTYTGTPYDHRIEFTFIDWGQGSEPFAHHLSMQTMGSLTVDPYLITLSQGYAISQAQQSTTTIPATVYNPNGGSLTYRWLEGATLLKTATVNGTGYLNVPLNLSGLSAFAVGAHTLTLEVTDGAATATATTVLTVTAGAPPPASGRPVPVLVGWWLLAALLSGAGIISRSRR
jgi:hypothetical protein